MWPTQEHRYVIEIIVFLKLSSKYWIVAYAVVYTVPKLPSIWMDRSLLDFLSIWSISGESQRLHIILNLCDHFCRLQCSLFVEPVLLSCQFSGGHHGISNVKEIKNWHCIGSFWEPNFNYEYVDNATWEALMSKKKRNATIWCEKTLNFDCTIINKRTFLRRWMLPELSLSTSMSETMLSITS